MARKPKTGVSRGTSDESYEENDIFPGRRIQRPHHKKTIIIKIKQQEISSKHTPTKSTNYKITEYKWTATTFITLFREIEWYPNLHIAVSYEIIHESPELKPNYLDKTEHN